MLRQVGIICIFLIIGFVYGYESELECPEGQTSCIQCFTACGDTVDSDCETDECITNDMDCFCNGNSGYYWDSNSDSCVKEDECPNSKK